MFRNPLYGAALIVGLSYCFSDAVAGHSVWDLVWKGASVGLLATWAAAKARSTDGRLFAAAFATYAIADVVIDAAGLIGGAAVFVVGHVLMILLYLRHRSPLTSVDRTMVGLLLVAVPLASFLLPADRDDAARAALYAGVLGAMAAAALASDFPRDRVLLGALLFVASDLLIFARMGPLSGSAVAEFAVWPLYFIGQALVASGVACGLRERRL